MAAWEKRRSGQPRCRVLEEYTAGGLSRPRLVAVKVAHAEPAADFRLSLANGRRIECSWRFDDAELVRLIRIAESA